MLFPVNDRTHGTVKVKGYQSALKHHFTSPKTDLIFLQLGVLG